MTHKRHRLTPAQRVAIAYSCVARDMVRPLTNKRTGEALMKKGYATRTDNGYVPTLEGLREMAEELHEELQSLGDSANFSQKRGPRIAEQHHLMLAYFGEDAAAWDKLSQQRYCTDEMPERSKNVFDRARDEAFYFMAIMYNGLDSIQIQRFDIRIMEWKSYAYRAYLEIMDTQWTLYDPWGDLSINPVPWYPR